MYHENNDRCHLIDICRGTILVNECYISSSSHIKKTHWKHSKLLMGNSFIHGLMFYSNLRKNEKISGSLKREGTEKVIVQ